MSFPVHMASSSSTSREPFHILDIVHSDVESHKLFPNKYHPPANREIIFHVIGNLKDGRPIHVGTFGFQLQLYFPATTQVVEVIDEYMQELSMTLNEETLWERRTLVQSNSIHGYQASPQPFWCVEFKSHRAWVKARNKLQDQVPIYDGNQDPVMQFMHRNNIQSQWVCFRQMNAADPMEETQFSTLELDYTAHQADLIVLNEMQDQPRCLVCSYDLETYASTYSTDKKGNQVRKFTDPTEPNDVITMVASRYRYLGEKEDQKVSVIVVGPCQRDEWMDQDKYQVTIVDNEHALHMSWMHEIKQMNPDILVAWNGDFFDGRFWYVRALHLGLIEKDDPFRPQGIFVSQLSRIPTIPMTLKRPYRPHQNQDSSLFIKKEVKTNNNNKDSKKYLLPPPLPSNQNTLSNHSWHSSLSNSNPSSSSSKDIKATATIKEEQDGIEKEGSGKNWKQDYARLKIPGRLVIDPQVYCQGNVKLTSYSLRAVSDHYKLGAKDDVSPNTIFAAWENKDPKLTSVVAKYCAQDTLLPLLYMDRVEMLTDIMECAHVNCVIVNDIITRGQQRRCSSLVFKAAYQVNKLIPYNPDFDKKMEAEPVTLAENEEDPNVELDDRLSTNTTANTLKTQGGKAWEGAEVLQPKKGEHMWVETLDFESLYPSIMRAYNLCYSTNIRDPDLLAYLLEHQKQNIRKVIIREANKYKKDDPEVAAYFVRKHTQEGILSIVLNRLIAERGKYKKIKAQSQPGTLQYMLADTRQKQRKVAANSVYGTLGKVLPAPEIGASVCAMGREALQLTKKIMEEDGYIVVYGDTDSVFVKRLEDETRPRSLAEVFKTGQAQAAKITAQFEAPMNLQFEKVFSRLILLNKKVYTGLKYMSADQAKPTYDDTGCIKMDQFPFASRNFCRFRELVLQEGGKKGIDLYIEEFKHEMQNILENKSLNYYDFAQTKKWSGKDIAQGQAVVAKKMKERGINVNAGDPITFVTTYMRNVTNVSPKAEDVKYAAEHKLPLDLRYYLKALEKNVLRIAEVLDPATCAVSKIKTTVITGTRYYDNKYGHNQGAITDHFAQRPVKREHNNGHVTMTTANKRQQTNAIRCRVSTNQPLINHPLSLGQALRKEIPTIHIKQEPGTTAAGSMSIKKTKQQLIAEIHIELARKGDEMGISYCKNNHINY